MLAVEIPKLYKALQAAHRTTVPRSQQILRDQKWIWTGAGFVGSSQVALRHVVPFQPGIVSMRLEKLYSASRSFKPPAINRLTWPEATLVPL